MTKNLVFITKKPMDQARKDKLITRMKLLRENNWECSIKEIGFLSFLSLIKFIRNYKGIVITISNPLWVHLIGVFMKKVNKYDFVWIAEFRDRINEYHLSSNFLEKYESNADKIISIKGIGNIQKHFKNKKILLLDYLGYNEEDFKDVKPLKLTKYDFVYTGKLYFADVEPKSFLIYYKKFIEKNKLTKDDTKAYFYTKNWCEYFNLYLKELGLEEFVLVMDYIPNFRSVLKGSYKQIYLGVLGKDEDYVFSKFWDYLGSGRDIIFFNNYNEKLMNYFITNREDYKRIYHDIGFLNMVGEYE